MSETITLTSEQFEALLNKVAAGGDGRTKEERLEELRLQADLQAEANRRALRPENERHPGVSVFSRPGGELKNPKGDLPFKFFWAGTPEGPDVLTAEEFDLIPQLTAGDYICTKTDGSRFKVSVVVEKNDATGEPKKVMVQFPIAGAQKHNLPSKAAMCRELIAQAARSAHGA